MPERVDEPDGLDTRSAGERLGELLRQIDSEIDFDGRDAVDSVRLGLADSVEEELRLVGGDLALHHRCGRVRARIVVLRARRRRLAPAELARQLAHLRLTVDAVWIASAGPDAVFDVTFEDGRNEVLTAAGRTAAARRLTVVRWRARGAGRCDAGDCRARAGITAVAAGVLGGQTRGPPADDEDGPDPAGPGHVGRRRRGWAP